MGAQQTQTTTTSQPGLSFLLGSDKVQLTILKNDALAQRGKIIDTILGLASLGSSSNQLYLAAPKVLGATIDGSVFRSYGIGLLLYDDRRIEEAVPPQSVQAPQHEAGAHASDAMVISELTTLKSMYMEMERDIAKLREDLKGFQEKFARTSSTTDHVLRPSIPPAQNIFTNTGSQLPSFFTNNPWLDVLSKRGRGEDEPIAA